MGGRDRQDRTWFLERGRIEQRKPRLARTGGGEFCLPSAGHGGGGGVSRRAMPTARKTHESRHFTVFQGNTEFRCVCVSRRNFLPPQRRLRKRPLLQRSDVYGWTLPSAKRRLRATLTFDEATFSGGAYFYDTRRLRATLPSSKRRLRATLTLDKRRLRAALTLDTRRLGATLPSSKRRLRATLTLDQRRLRAALTLDKRRLPATLRSASQVSTAIPVLTDAVFSGAASFNAIHASRAFGLADARFRNPRSRFPPGPFHRGAAARQCVGADPESGDSRSPAPRHGRSGPLPGS